MTLQKQWDSKFDHIVRLIGQQLYGEGTLTATQQEDAANAAQEAVDDWEMAEVDEVHGLKITTELQRLLADQHELAERILDERDA